MASSSTFPIFFPILLLTPNDAERTLSRFCLSPFSPQHVKGTILPINDIVERLRQKTKKSLSGDKLTMHTAWQDLGDVADLLEQNPSDVNAARKQLDAIRARLFVPGKHNSLTIYVEK